jgi:hypothetical protein
MCSSLTMEIVKMGAMMGSSKSHDYRILSSNMLIIFVAVGVIIGFIFGSFLTLDQESAN